MQGGGQSGAAHAGRGEFADSLRHSGMWQRRWDGVTEYLRARRTRGRIFGVVWQTKHRSCYRICNDLLQSVTVNPPLVFQGISLQRDETCTCTTRRGTAEAFV